MSLLDGDAAVASASLPGGTSDAVLSVGSPKLWWPVGMGSGPFLYSLHVATPTDSFRTRVGLREVCSLLTPSATQSLRRWSWHCYKLVLAGVCS